MNEDKPQAAAVPAKVSVNGIHMIRTAQQIHVQLSQMADQKASILMGATFVIFTISIGQGRSSGVPLPLMVLGAFAFFAAVFAVLAILPAIHSSKRGSLNLLFFGSFTRLEEEDYIERMVAQLAEDDSIYRTMARDIYQNGLVLERKKYRFLGYAYRIFLAGLTISFLTFLVDWAIHLG